MIVAESDSNIRITSDTSYLALTGELCGAYCEEFEENWPCYNGTAPYLFDVASINTAMGDMRQIFN